MGFTHMLLAYRHAAGSALRLHLFTTEVAPGRVYYKYLLYLLGGSNAWDYYHRLLHPLKLPHIMKTGQLLFIEIAVLLILLRRWCRLLYGAGHILLRLLHFAAKLLCQVACITTRLSHLRHSLLGGFFQLVSNL